MRFRNTQDLESIKEILLQSKYAVFFGGAGVSTDSGIPDFRGNGGLYEEDEEANAYYLSKACLKENPEVFYEFFRKNMLFRDAVPNDTHRALVNLEKRGIIKAVLTQNVDGLHQAAGSQQVIELHGSAARYYCMRCGTMYDSQIIELQNNVPCCTQCGSVVRPDVTLYGEHLDGFNYAEAVNAVSKADVLLVGGSSLVVHPAASLLNLYRGEHLIIINYSPTPYDGLAEFVLRESLSEVFNYLAEA
jgi:NAD-dependent deacetylase